MARVDGCDPYDAVPWLATLPTWKDEKAQERRACIDTALQGQQPLSADFSWLAEEEEEGDARCGCQPWTSINSNSNTEAETRETESRSQKGASGITALSG